MKKWWFKDKEIPIQNGNFQKIVDFYLFNCPSTITRRKGKTKKRYPVSQRAFSLEKYGWNGKLLQTLLATMKHPASGHLVYQTFKSNEDIEAETTNILRNSTLADPHFEMILMQERTDMNKTSSIFYYIRNAFAHGSFSVVGKGENKTYYFESSRDEKIKARIRLREQTLLNWIQDVQLSPDALRKALEQNSKKKKSTTAA